MIQLQKYLYLRHSFIENIFVKFAYLEQRWNYQRKSYYLQCLNGCYHCWYISKELLFFTDGFSKNLFTWWPFSFEFSRLETIPNISISFLLFLAFLAISIMLFSIVCGSWLDLKSFVPTWIMTRLRLSWKFDVSPHIFCS